MNKLEVLKVVTEVPIFLIRLQIMKRASLEGLHPVVYLSVCILHTEQTNACLFSKSYIYPPLAYLKLRKLSVPHQCIGQLYNKIHIIRKWNPGASVIEHLLCGTKRLTQCL